jgi:hypothetical protein
MGSSFPRTDTNNRVAKSTTIPTGRQLQRSPQGNTSEQPEASNTQADRIPRTPRQKEKEQEFRPKTPGAFPQSSEGEDTQPPPNNVSERPWVIADKEGTLGVRDLPQGHPAFYSKTQYEADCELIVHFANNHEIYKGFPFFRYLANKPIYWSARGVLQTAPDSKIQGLAKKNRPYRHDGKLFDWLTDESSFPAWIKRFRAGPTCRRADTEPLSEEDSIVPLARPKPQRSGRLVEETREPSISPTPNRRMTMSMMNWNEAPVGGEGPSREARGKQPFNPTSATVTNVPPSTIMAGDKNMQGGWDNNWARFGQENRPFRAKEDHQIFGAKIVEQHQVPTHHRESSDERRERELSEQARRFNEALTVRDAQMAAMMKEIDHLKSQQRATIDPLMHTQDARYHTNPPMNPSVPPQDVRYQGYERPNTARDPRNYQAQEYVSHRRGEVQNQGDSDRYGRQHQREPESPARSHHRYRSEYPVNAREPAYQTVECGSPRDRQRFDPYRAANRRMEPISRPAYQNEPDDRRYSHTMSYGGRSRLRPQDVLLWDPKELSPVFFADRFWQVSETHGAEEVLSTLPLCLRGAAIGWHNGLPRSTKTIMNRSLEEWEKQLLMEFMPNQSEANRTAKQLRFKFDNTSELSLTSYLREKQQALRDAGYRDEAAIKLALWETLDIELKGITALKTYESLPEFVARVRENESAAFASWQASRKSARLGNIPNRSGYQRENRSGGRQSAWPYENRSPGNREKNIDNGRDRRNDRSTPKPDRTDTKDTDRATAKPTRPAKEPRRPCRHCKGSHWDNDCPRRPKAYHVDDGDESVSELDDDDVAMDDLESSDDSDAGNV